MYYRHPLLKEPEPGAALWRYMDFTKFLGLLETRHLHLAPLIKFNDPFEGHPPRSIVAAYQDMAGKIEPEEIARRKAIIEHNLKTFRDSRQLMFASCWHMNETESAAMWSLYLRSGEGIAIRTTLDRLENSLKATPIEITGGMVNYVDYDTFAPDRVNVLVWATLKRISFAHEREFRLLVLGQHGPAGISVPVVIPDLVESIWLSPTTPDWIAEVLRRVVARYEVACPIHRSVLNVGPDYIEGAHQTRAGQ